VSCPVLKVCKTLSIITLCKRDFNNELDQGSEKYQFSIFLHFP